ncbi:MAG: hypothetical protein WA756_26470, partial [Pseudolabrys sp.]
AVVIPFFQKTIGHTAKSPKRYWKLVRFLESQISNPRNNNAPNMEKAMIEWSEDLRLACPLWAKRRHRQYLRDVRPILEKRKRHTALTQVASD